jgi:hypothetical protein
MTHPLRLTRAASSPNAKMPEPLPDVSQSLALCKNTAQKCLEFYRGDFIFKLNKLEANPLFIINFLTLPLYN